VIPDDVNEAARALPESQRAAEEKQARSLLERTYGAKTTVPTRFSVRRGNVAVEMLRFPAETNAELMVIGSRRLGRLTGLVGGCIGERVVKNAEIPVLVVPMHADLKR
jgi:nucleotide-binding universal stress UspA family protein